MNINKRLEQIDTRIDIKNKKRYVSVPGTYNIHVDRGTVLGNYAGASRPNKFNIPIVSAKKAIELYHNLLIKQLEDPSNSVTKAIDEIVTLLLRGNSVTLWCWCKPAPCHGDIIRDIVLAKCQDVLKEQEQKKNSL